MFALVALLAALAQERGAPRIGIADGGASVGAAGAVLFSGSTPSVFVADSDRDQISVWTTIGFSNRLGAPDERPPGLRDPHGLASGGSDGARLYVADSGHHRVVELSPDLSIVRSFGRYGGAPGEFRDPRGLAATKDALYVCDTGNDRVQKLALEGRPLAQVGTHGFAPGEFIRPLGVAVDDAGFVYVTDSGNHRVQKFDADLRFVKSWGDFGPHPGFFAFPDGIAFFRGELFVVDTDNHRVQVFDTQGAVRYEWGVHALLPREGSGKLHYPSAIAVTDDAFLGPRAAVAEPVEGRVQCFVVATEGEEIPTNPKGVRVTGAHYGRRLALAGDLMAVTEPGAPALVLYDTEHGQTPWEPIEITRATLWGRKPGQLLRPGDVALDWQRKLLYVADVDALRVSCFRVAHDEHTPLGFDFFLLKFVRSLDLGELHRLGLDGAEFAVRPDALELDPWGGVALLDSLQRRLFHLTPEFELRAVEMPLLGARPVDFAFAPDGKSVCVVDELDGEVSVLAVRAGGAPALGPDVRRIGSHGTGDGQLVRASGVAVAADGSVFVSDSALDRVQRFGADGRFLASFGKEGVGRVEFHGPAGLAFDRSGRLWVDDWGNHRGQVLTPQGEFVVAFGSRWFVQPTVAAPGAPLK